MLPILWTEEKEKHVAAALHILLVVAGGALFRKAGLAALQCVLQSSLRSASRGPGTTHGSTAHLIVVRCAGRVRIGDTLHS